MAKESVENKNSYFTCKECGFLYKEKSLAEKCEKWCKEHHSCNISIAKYAVKLD